MLAGLWLCGCLARHPNKGPRTCMASSETMSKGCGSLALDTQSTGTTCSCMPGTTFLAESVFLSSPKQLLQVSNYVSLCTGPVLTCDMQVREIIFEERLLNPVRSLNESLPVASPAHPSENTHPRVRKVEFFIHRAKAGSGNADIAALKPSCPGRMCVAPGGGSRGGTGLQLLF